MATWAFFSAIIVLPFLKLCPQLIDRLPEIILNSLLGKLHANKTHHVLYGTIFLHILLLPF